MSSVAFLDHSLFFFYETESFVRPGDCLLDCVASNFKGLPVSISSTLINTDITGVL